MAVTMENQPVRATISFGGLIVNTPNVVSFSVRRARGQMCATFTASVRVSSSYLASSKDVVNASIVIKAGFKGAQKTILTGKIFKATINPIRTDASKVMLSLSGKDVLHIMEGQKINRRIKTYRDGEKPPERWGLINSITQENIGMKSSFPVKLTSRRPKAVKAMGLPGVIYTDSAYGDKIDRGIADVVGSITTINMGPEE
jgi:hypothetical protein